MLADPVLDVQGKDYFFEQILACDMCGSPDSQNRILGQRMNVRQGLRSSRVQGISTTIKRCLSCGLIYPNPLPRPRKISDHYSLPPEEYWKQEYFNYSPSYFRPQAEKALSLLSYPLAGAVPQALDIGCGIGKAVKTLESVGFEAWGIEPSPSFYEKAVDFTGLPSQRLQNVSVEEASLPFNSFDFISFGAVFEHLYHPKECLERALRWLKPGGIIHIEVGDFQERCRRSAPTQAACWNSSSSSAGVSSVG